MIKKTLFLAISISSVVLAQDLKTTLVEVINTNPTIQERLKNYNATKEDIDIAKAGYYPKLDISIGIGRETNQKRTNYDGNTTLVDENGASVDDSTLSVSQSSITLTQNIFDGFSTNNQVSQQKHATKAAAYSYIENVNDIAYKLVDTYLQVMRNNELLQTSKANVQINEEISKKVQKLYDAGLTTLSEVNKIESSLSLAKSNYVVQENTLMDKGYNLQRIVGRYLDADKMHKPLLNIALPANIEGAAQYAMNNNPSILVAEHNLKQAQYAYKDDKSVYYPTIDLEISQTMNKNLVGVIGDDNRLRAMAYVRYNLFNGFADKAKIQKSISKIHQNIETKNDIRRQILEGLNLSWAANEKLGDKLEHLNEYKKFALKTLTLYSKEYDLGRRSLLDLLSAQNDFIAAKQQIINTEYSMLFAKYRILDSMGTLVQTILGNETVNVNVGIETATPENTDSLPVSYDRDLDLISDNMDICNNSIKTTMRNIYGCKSDFNNTKKIDRYTGFIFDDGDDAAILTQDSEAKLNGLIKQLTPYGFKNLKFDIIGNVDNDDMSKLDKEELSKQRAIYVRDKLIRSGAIDENIKIHANSDRAPMFSDESSDSIEKNNRVDIVVKKLKK